MGKKLNKGFHTTGEKTLRYVREDGTEIEVTKDNLGDFDIVEKLKFFINQYPKFFGGVFDLMGKQVVEDVEVLKSKSASLDLDLSKEEALALLDKLNPIVAPEASSEEEISEDETSADEEVAVEDESVVERKFSSPLAVHSIGDLGDIEKLSYTLDLLIDEMERTRDEKHALEGEVTELSDYYGSVVDKLDETTTRLAGAESDLESEITEHERTRSSLLAERTAHEETKAKAKRYKRITALVAGLSAFWIGMSAGLGVSLFKKNEKIKDQAGYIDSQGKYIDELENTLAEAEKNVANFFGVSDVDIDSLNSLMIEKNEEIKTLAEAFGWKSQVMDENGNMVKNPEGAYFFLLGQSGKIEDFATKLGYDAESGETISEFIERISNTDASEMLKQIEDFKKSLRDNGFDVEDGKTLTELLQQVYDKNASDISDEVKKAYVGFANLLSDLGVSVEDVLDENGDLDVSGFNDEVASVVKLAKDNLETLENLETQFDAVFESLGLEKKVKDFDSIEDAFDEIIDSYDEIVDSIDDSLSDYLDKAFLEAKIPNGTSYYAPSDFATLEEAGNFLIDYCKNNKELKEKVSEYESQISTLTAEKANLQSQISSLETKVAELERQKSALESEKNNLEKNYKDLLDKDVSGSSNQGSSGSADEKGTETTPVAGEEKDEQGNDGSSDSGSGKGNGSSAENGRDYDLDY